LEELVISSPAFGQNKAIPAKYTCDGANVNPPLQIRGIPEGAKSLVLIVEDPDAPMGLWIHWVVWNVPITSTISENSIPGMEGTTTSKKRRYGGPCPPSGTHRYFFKVYALDTRLDLSGDAQKRDVEEAMQNHILAKGELVGLYSRHRM
jgi:Raf kinase inhibitor-like YbhB/YbcL family protein